MDHSGVDGDDDYAPPGRVGRLMRGASTLVGAGLMVALVVGGGVWLYRLGVRDAANVPVIRASLDPTKELPDAPGGVETPHQQIGSYSLADATEPAPATAELAPPPPRPTPQDVAPLALAPVPSAAAVTPILPEPEPEPEPQAEPAPQPTEAPPADDPVAVDPDLTAAVTQALAEAAAPQTGDLSGATPLAPAASPAVRPRPADLTQRVAAAGREAVADQGALATAAARSSVKVQLGAFPSRDFTEGEWARIARANPDLLTGRALSIEATVSGGATWYRLRVGPFRDRAEAASICAALKARGHDCIVAANG